MSDVTKLDDHRPHMTGTATCRNCQHFWQAVAPIYTFDLECPSCGHMAGYIDPNLNEDGHYDEQ